MKILIIQEASRHTEDIDYRESLSLSRAFKAYNWDVTVWGLNQPTWGDEINFNSYDYIFNLENYGDNWLPDLSNITKPYKILWSIDAHFRGIQPYEYIFNQGKYNLLLHSTKDYATKKHTAWFPNAFCDQKIVNLNLPTKYDLGFVGNHANRKSLLDYLTTNFNLKQFIGTRGDEMVRVINELKIHFNKNISNDINYRSFETIGCGTLLLTNYNSQYLELGFKDMENVVFYDDINSLHEKIKLIQTDEKQLKSISEQGYLLSKKHTYTKRVGSLIKFLQSC